ncbi:hypothetical protein TNCV_591801 [Trichonephila clavipes]|nr:hypothetical protein TNCV_591801 [Trichonephila clavipes]
MIDIIELRARNLVPLKTKTCRAEELSTHQIRRDLNLPIGVVLKCGEGVLVQVSSWSLKHCSKLRDLSQRVLDYQIFYTEITK